VAQPAEEVGAAAARFVAAMLAGAPGRECQAELPVRFVARETTGPPAYV
jgi:DNA-binding LacI/PurR family transcriptional regulator